MRNSMPIESYSLLQYLLIYLLIQYSERRDTLMSKLFPNISSRKRMHAVKGENMSPHHRNNIFTGLEGEALGDKTFTYAISLHVHDLV